MRDRVAPPLRPLRELPPHIVAATKELRRHHGAIEVKRQDWPVAVAALGVGPRGTVKTGQ
jgi:hypothetical protein